MPVTIRIARVGTNEMMTFEDDLKELRKQAMGYTREERLGQKEELVQRPRIYQITLPEGNEQVGTTQPREFVGKAKMA